MLSVPSPPTISACRRFIWKSLMPNSAFQMDRTPILSHWTVVVKVNGAIGGLRSKERHGRETSGDRVKKHATVPQHAEGTADWRPPTAATRRFGQLPAVHGPGPDLVPEAVVAHRVVATIGVSPNYV